MARDRLDDRRPAVSVVDVLQQVGLFSDLTAEERALVADTSRRRRFAKGTQVFQEGDVGDYLLVVLEGRVRVSLLGEDGQETIINVLEPPALLGEVAVLDKAPRSATVTAVEATTCLQITRGPFLALMRAHPSIAEKIMIRLAGALRRATEQIRTLSMFDVNGRVLRSLLVLGQERGQMSGSRMLIRPRPSVTDLSHMTGCARETVSRALKVLESKRYLSSIDGGLAVEEQAIRRYWNPALQNVGEASKPVRPRRRA